MYALTNIVNRNAPKTIEKFTERRFKTHDMH